MKRLINVEALGIGGLDDTITPSDIDILDNGGTIQVSLTQEALQNEEKNLHNNAPWSDTKYYPNSSTTSVIAFMTYSFTEAPNEDNSDKMIIIQVGYLENRPEYRKTKVFEYLMNFFLEEIVKPTEQNYGKDHVFLSAMFANPQLGKVVKRYFNKKHDGAKWVDQMPAGYSTALDDEDDYYEDNYEEEDDYYEHYFEDEDNQSNANYLNWMMNQFDISSATLFSDYILINGKDNIKNYIEGIEDRRGDPVIWLGIFADGSMKATVPTYNDRFVNYTFPSGYVIGVELDSLNSGLIFDENSINNLPQVKDKIDDIVEQLKNMFEYYDSGIEFNGETLTLDQFKEKAHQIADAGALTANNRLKLVVEAIGLGGLDTSITESDVSFTLTEDRLEENLINLEKSLHGDKPWDDAEYSNGGGPNLIASMKFDKQEIISYNDPNDKSLSIFIGSLENRPEYRKTKVFEYLMMYFLENVVNPAVKTYGENKVILDASFANEQLGRIVKRYFSKNGKGAIWQEDEIDDYDDQHMQLRDLLTTNGATVVNFEKDVVKNFDVNQYVNMVYDVYAEGNRDYIDYMPVGVNSDGDVVYSWFNDGYSFTYSGAIVEFEYVYSQNIFKLSSHSLNELKKIYNENVKNNLIICFGGSVVFNVRDTNESYTLDQLMQGTEEKTASRLKKISAKDDLKNKVYDYLKENYPEDVLDWVKKANWSIETIPLSEINMSRRPGGRNMGKVEGIAKAIQNGEKMDPVVLVKQSNGRYQVADGYHRTLGFQKAGEKEIMAYVAEGVGDDGPWDEEMHAKKLNVEPGKKASRFTGLRKLSQHKVTTNEK